jgi:hypothetical protein
MPVSWQRRGRAVEEVTGVAGVQELQNSGAERFTEERESGARIQESEVRESESHAVYEETRDDHGDQSPTQIQTLPSRNADPPTRRYADTFLPISADKTKESVEKFI